MTLDLPLYIPSVFILATILTYSFFIIAVNKQNSARTTFIISLIMLLWLTIQYFLAKNDFYQVTNTLPPRIALLGGPPLLGILFLFISRRGRKFIDSLPSSILTLLHSVRILVELTLFWLFAYRAVPLIMTFEGRNFDILAGLSAPFVYYFGFVNSKIGKGFMITWNIICLLLLFNIVIIAILSIPTPFQRISFNQPNIAILYFPFNWLPCFVVPAVLFSHLAVLRKLLSSQAR